MTQGHHPTHTGLQKHSVGDIYPLAIVGVGDEWQLHNLATGEVLHYDMIHNTGPVSRLRPSQLLKVWRVVESGTSAARYRWVKPATAASQPAPEQSTPMPTSRANWYGEQGTDPVQTEADLPPPGLNLFVGAMLTEEESNLIRAFRSVKPYDRSLVLHFTNKLKA